LKHASTNGRKILKLISKGTRYQGMDWTKVFQDRNQWCAAVNRVMKLQVKEEA
jgi:hypothetical protein